MESNPEASKISPPRLIPAVTEGFNLVANHIQLILLPVALDLVLWFAPHLRLKALLTPFMDGLNLNTLLANNPDMVSVLPAIKELWQTTLEHFNILSILRTYPIGIPSIFSSTGPLKNPLGEPVTVELLSSGGVFWLWVLLIILGTVLGTLFLSEIERASDPEQPKFSMLKYFWQSSQMLKLTLLCFVMALVIAIPLSLLFSLISLLSSFLMQLFMIMIALILIWILIPLIFTPHVILVNQKSPWRAMLFSFQMVRFFMPGTGIFLMTAVMFNQGLDILWRIPPESSWMALVGILGHGFISTALFAASFEYFRGGLRWMQSPASANRRTAQI